MTSLQKVVKEQQQAPEESGLDDQVLGSMEKWKRAANTPYQSEDHFNKECFQIINNK